MSHDEVNWDNIILDDVVLATDVVDDVHHPYPGALFIHNGIGYNWLKSILNGDVIGWLNQPTDASPFYQHNLEVGSTATMTYTEVVDGKTEPKMIRVPTTITKTVADPETGGVKYVDVQTSKMVPNPYYDDKPDYRS